MTPREKRLAFFLVLLILVIGGAGLYYVFLHRPFTELDSSIKRARTDMETRAQGVRYETKKRQEVLGENPRLDDWKEISIPSPSNRSKLEVKKHQDRMQVDYERYLSQLLQASRIDMGQITISPKGYDEKRSPRLSGKTPLYANLTFTIQGQTAYRNIVTFLEKFHQAPLLHHVRNLTLNKPRTRSRSSNNKNLDFLITVEALQVTGAKKRDELLPEKEVEVSETLAADRDYRSILDKDIFEGTPPKEKPEAEKPREDVKLVLGSIKLNHIEHTGRRWEARFYDQGKGEERKISPGLFLREFTILDQYDNDVIKAEVVHISNTRKVVLKYEDRYYDMYLGDFLSDVFDEPLEVIEESRRYIVYHGSEGYVKLPIGEDRRTKPPEVLQGVPLLIGPAALVESQ